MLLHISSNIYILTKLYSIGELFMGQPIDIKYLDEVGISESTTIAIKKTTWDILNAQKRCGESFDDVIRRRLMVAGEPLV